MAICDLASANHQVVRNDSAHRFVAAADGFIGNLERCKGLGSSGAHVVEGLLAKVERARGGVGLEVGPGAVALDSVAPFGIFHSNSISGLVAVLGRIFTL